MSTIKHIRELTARLLDMEEDAPEIDRIIIELANALDTFRYIHEKGPVRLSIVSRQ